MAELSTVLGGEDLYNIVEVLVVDAENNKRAHRAEQAKRKQQPRGRF